MARPEVLPERGRRLATRRRCRRTLPQRSASERGVVQEDRRILAGSPAPRQTHLQPSSLVTGRR